MTKFEITSGGGFHITFASGWTVSVQFSPGTYSDNHDTLWRLPPRRRPQFFSCATAEVWAFNGDRCWPEDPIARVTPEALNQVLAAAERGDFSGLEGVI